MQYYSYGGSNDFILLQSAPAASALEGGKERNGSECNIDSRNDKDSVVENNCREREGGGGLIDGYEKTFSL